MSSERINHGTDGFLEILCSTIESVRKICDENGQDMPEHLVIQTDNTVAQSKNSFSHLFMAFLVSRRLFKTVTMNYFMVGHTHEDIDQLFALVVKIILQKTTYETPTELLEYIVAHLRPKVEARGELVHARLLTAVRDFCAWLLPIQLTLHNGFQNRGGIETAHSFTYKTGRQLSLSQKQMVVRECELPGVQAIREESIFCVIKAYMRDVELNQAPLLVLEQRDTQRVVASSPDRVVPPHALSDTTEKACLVLAELLELPRFGLTNAAKALKELVHGTAYEVVRLTWLDAGRCLPLAPAEPVENVVFDHLPKITWPMRVRGGACMPKGRRGVVNEAGLRLHDPIA